MAFPKKDLGTFEDFKIKCEHFIATDSLPTYQGLLLHLGLSSHVVKDWPPNNKFKSLIEIYHKQLNLNLFKRAVFADEKANRTVTINSHLAKTWDEWRKDLGSRSITVEEDGKVVINLGNSGTNKIDG